MGKTDETETKTERGLSWNDDDCYDVSFGVGKSRRYHAYMREWYRRCHDLSLASAAVAGSAAFVALIPASPDPTLPRILTAIVAVSTILDLVLNWSKKADKHDELNRRFSELAARMNEMSATEENRLRACAERIRIEADEPTERRVIDLRAHNDELRARGVSISELLPLSWCQNMAPWAYCFNFGLDALQKRMRAQEEANKALSA